MSQLATIFEKIKNNFFDSLLSEEDKEQYQLIFAPFSTGFTSDDFLFLDTNKASEDAHKYLDELYEFSQIANTIPSSDNYWATSEDKSDYLFVRYKTILHFLKLIDTDTLTAEMLYEHPTFWKILIKMDAEVKGTYEDFFQLKRNLENEIQSLKASLNSTNEATVNLETSLKEDNLIAIQEKWNTEGNKEAVESKIIGIIKAEAERFISKLTESKAILDSTHMTHVGSSAEFHVTYCLPNNLYQADNLKWKKIHIGKEEIKQLLKSDTIQTYETILGGSDLSKLDLESVSFELLFVNVTRSWFDETLLESPFWDIDIIDRDEIDIPNITSKLIFVRNIGIKFNRNSQHNLQLLSTTSAKNLGPFIVNPTLLKSGTNLELKSVNKALSVDRKIVMNVASNIKTKEKTRSAGQPTANMVAEKQRQFVKLAPQIQKRSAAIKTMRLNYNPALAVLNAALRTYELDFVDAKTKQKIYVSPHEAKIFINKKKQNISFTQTNSGALSVRLSKNSNYRIVIAKKKYRKTVVNINSAINNKMTIALESNAKKPLIVKPFIGIKAIPANILVSAILKLPVESKLLFADSKTNQSILVSPHEVSVFKDNKKQDVVIKQMPTGELSVKLSKNNNYKIVVEKQGYYKAQMNINTTTDAKEIKKTMLLVSPEAEKDDESFQLIGVISKKMIKYPNPIKKADYL